MRSLFNAVRMFSISGTVVGALVLSAGPAHGGAYPAAYWWSKTTGVDVSTRVNTARQALAAAGVSGSRTPPTPRGAHEHHASLRRLRLAPARRRLRR